VEEHLISAAADRGRAYVIVIFARPGGGESPSRLRDWDLTSLPSPLLIDFSHLEPLAQSRAFSLLGDPPQDFVSLSYRLALPVGSFLSLSLSLSPSLSWAMLDFPRMRIMRQIDPFMLHCT